MLTHGILSCDTALAQNEIQDPVLFAWTQLGEVAECVRCHYEPPKILPADFIRQTEGRRWLEDDKHAIARRRVEPFTADQVPKELERLQQEYRQFARSGDVEQWVGPSNLLSHAICTALGYEVATEEGYGQFRDNCLTCHGGYSLDQPSSTDAFSKDGKQPGIGCIYCHQLGDKEAWVKIHGDPDGAWRLRDPDEKISLGQRNLVSSAEQAALCLDCHVGNIPQNKFVTHAMYAAGHPPLPGFELQTFSRSMPQHWQTPAELYAALKDDRQRDQYFVKNYPELFAGDPPAITPAKIYWNTRNVLIGALAARRHWLQLIDDAAQSDRWGDYALYDCSACHHELRRVSLRQQRGYLGVPGRPRQMEWPSAITQIASGFSDNRDKLEEAERKLETEFSRQPFGDQNGCGEIAGDGARVLSSMLKQVSAAPIDRSAAIAVRTKLLKQPLDKLVEYQSARQIIWALLVVAEEDHRHVDGQRLDPLVFAKLKQLPQPTKQGVSVDLPAGRKQFIFPGFLREELKRQAAYNPAVLKRQLESLRVLWDSDEP